MCNLSPGLRSLLNSIGIGDRLTLGSFYIKTTHICLMFGNNFVHEFRLLHSILHYFLICWPHMAKYFAAVAMVILPCILNVMVNILFNKKGISLFNTTVF